MRATDERRSETPGATEAPTSRRRHAWIGSMDMLIAAHARALGRTIVTDNTREFSRVAGLKMENWALE